MTSMRIKSSEGEELNDGSCEGTYEASSVLMLEGSPEGESDGCSEESEWLSGVAPRSDGVRLACEDGNRLGVGEAIDGFEDAPSMDGLALGRVLGILEGNKDSEGD